MGRVETACPSGDQWAIDTGKSPASGDQGPAKSPKKNLTSEEAKAFRSDGQDQPRGTPAALNLKDKEEEIKEKAIPLKENEEEPEEKASTLKEKEESEGKAALKDKEPEHKTDGSKSASKRQHPVSSAASSQQTISSDSSKAYMNTADTADSRFTVGGQKKPFYPAYLEFMKEIGTPTLTIHFEHVLKEDRDLAIQLCKRDKHDQSMSWDGKYGLEDMVVVNCLLKIVYEHRFDEEKNDGEKIHEKFAPSKFGLLNFQNAWMEYSAFRVMTANSSSRYQFIGLMFW
ncbi:hypothetical protein E2562_010609 [Oryza meyeriana var. granulata]|uniref:Uncharacterized protein n=1 Tax=Oryza meyeriana var. granulata TaxID=110450 RepID=A0A6G1BVH6_9ORYZ|nr:hypothetical protein E2562_010609 [Oryza meyeriana var. granulata]